MLLKNYSSGLNRVRRCDSAEVDGYCDQQAPRPRPPTLRQEKC